jgi:hypothetical protein
MSCTPLGKNPSRWAGEKSGWLLLLLVQTAMSCRLGKTSLRKGQNPADRVDPMVSDLSLAGENPSRKLSSKTGEPEKTGQKLRGKLCKR